MEPRHWRGLDSFVVLLLLSVILGFSPPGVGQAEATLSAITMDKTALWSPGMIAVGGDGALYVADGYKDHILIFDSAGNYRGEIKYPKVSAIAMAADGTLYIGSHADYSVAIYRGGAVVGRLGAGAGEFVSIKDITVDGTTGNVYVADSAANAVKVYSSTGAALSVITGLNLPIGVSISGDEIYIVDAPIIQETKVLDPPVLFNGEYIDTVSYTSTVPRVSVYDRAGVLMRSFTNRDSGEHMGKPTDIAVDDGGTIYISDAGRNAVLVYDATGTYIGKMTRPLGELQAAVSVALSGDGRVYVSSSEKQSIVVFDAATDISK